MESDKTKVRFESYIMPEPNTGCWLWTGYITKSGYGSFEIKRDGKFVPERAHRTSVRIYKNIDPGKMFVCHKCDVRSCVNPDHLWIGTHSENMLDSSQKKRHRFTQRKACSKGHKYEVGSFSVRKKNGLSFRACLICSRIYDKNRNK